MRSWVFWSPFLLSPRGSRPQEPDLTICHLSTHHFALTVVRDAAVVLERVRLLELIRTGLKSSNADSHLSKLCSCSKLLPSLEFLFFNL